MSTSTMEKPKKHISELTAEYKPFWQPLFDNMGLSNPTFGAKLGYLGKEFMEDGKRVPAVRFFPNELTSGNDYYLELYNWDQTYYHPESRVLYRLRHDPKWSMNDKYVEVPSDKLPVPTYAVKISDLEVVNMTPVTAKYPDMAKPGATEEPALFGAGSLFDHHDEEEDVYTEKEDDHYTKMTVRDLYCMMQNVPLSNKKWLNDLINKGKQWQK